MKRGISRNLAMTVLFIIAGSMVLGGCGGQGVAGVEIMTQPVTKIYINGREAGMTPYRNSALAAGLVDIRLGEEGLGWWEKKIKLEKNISTVINWTFNKTEKKSGGYILSMEKLNSNKAGLILASWPTGAAVSIEGELKGETPMGITDLGAGDKEVKIVMPGFKTINIGIRPVAGYRILIEATLPQEEETIAATDTNGTQPTLGMATKRIKVLETETGWLRVRSDNNSASQEVGRINTGEEYELLEEKNGWIKINFNGKTGWVSAKYVSKL